VRIKKGNPTAQKRGKKKNKIMSEFLNYLTTEEQKKLSPEEYLRRVEVKNDRIVRSLCQICGVRLSYYRIMVCGKFECENCEFIYSMKFNEETKQIKEKARAER
jgi:hypothetical protein